MTLQTICDALRDITGLLSLKLFFESLAGMWHIYQFTSSLRKSYHRASRAFLWHRRRLATGYNKKIGNEAVEIGEDAKLSTSTTALQ